MSKIIKSLITILSRLDRSFFNWKTVRIPKMKNEQNVHRLQKFKKSYWQNKGKKFKAEYVYIFPFRKSCFHARNQLLRKAVPKTHFPMYLDSTQQSKAFFLLLHFLTMKLLHTTLNSLNTVANNDIFKMCYPTGIPSCPQRFYHACVLEKH